MKGDNIDIETYCRWTYNLLVVGLIGLFVMLIGEHILHKTSVMAVGEIVVVISGLAIFLLSVLSD